ncbi:galactose oxidase [Ascobolus immersus RN42]|uniref:Galactose oxidase n=1 Tax=Ascobolus immersus RN42 TaxID=1160509 RepID=A0A3N4ID06_ASCIM|nr:galactose oxidase [Ascobolus immersus RN42]
MAPSLPNGGSGIPDIPSLNITGLQSIDPQNITELTPQLNYRPELQILSRAGQNFAISLEELENLEQLKPLYRRTVSCNLLKDEGNKLFKANKYDEAIIKYKQAARKIVGQDANFPTVTTENNMKQPRYMQLVWQELLDLVACCNNISICFKKSDRMRAAISWSLETQALYQNQRFNHKNFSWKDINSPILEYYTGQQKMHLRLSQLFYELRNTACAVHHALNVTTLLDQVPYTTTKAPAQMEKISKEADLRTVAQLRHPDIAVSDRLEVKYPDLQVRGSWKKIGIESSKVQPAARLGTGCFIWNSRLYVCGGQEQNHLRSKDFWCIPLPKKRNSTMAGAWRQLPDVPVDPRFHNTAGMPIQVYNDKAYVFYGSPTLQVFDLRTEKWSTLATVLVGKRWPYVRNSSSEHALEVLNGKLYVFGGQDGRDQLGNNIFMVLDLSNNQWQYISGLSKPTPTWKEPMLRVYPGSWADPIRNRFFLHHGNANRMSQLIKEPRGEHAADQDHTYDDTWSYNPTTKQWIRENVTGNYPCPRTEHSLVFNKHLNGDKGGVICFGGYSATTTTYIPEQNVNFTYAYFADTFLLDPETMVWRQVLTRGFPTYRAQHRLVVDPVTGRTFLFGGYTNSDFVPSKHIISRSFNDIWELRIDVPGGGIEEDYDWQDEERTAVMGPWKTCFNCGAVGPWRMCGGTCGGKAWYCGKTCSDEAWDEHRRVHRCQNKKALEAERRARERAANAAGPSGTGINGKSKKDGGNKKPANGSS